MTVPIGLIGVESAHAAANALFGSPGGSDELFAGPGSGAELLPLLVAVLLGLVLAGVAVRVAGCAEHAAARPGAVALGIALLPLLAFVALELLEGVLHEGGFPWDELVDPAFLAGLALQLPVAAAGYLVARLLLRAGDAVRRLLLRRGAAPVDRDRGTAYRLPRSDRAHASRRLAAWSGRAPPAATFLAAAP